MTMIICKECRVEKERYGNGLCRRCYGRLYHSKYRQIPGVKRRIKEYKKQYYQKNKPGIKVGQKIYRQIPEVKTRAKEYMKQYHQKNKASAKMKQKIYCQILEVKIRRKEYHKKYYQENKGKRRIYAKTYNPPEIICKTCGKKEPNHSNGICEKCYKKEYRQKPENKARARELAQKPERKVKQKEYGDRPEVKAKKREYGEVYRQKPEFKKRNEKYQKRYYERAKGKISEKAKKYYQLPHIQERIKQKQKKPEHIAWRKKYRKKRLQNPQIKLAHTMSSNINGCLNGIKNRRHWEDLVGYTTENLKQHIESQFEPGMTWENHGTYWHMDHRIPKKWYRYNYPEDEEFQACWALDNLQPLKVKSNLCKNSSYAEPTFNQLKNRVNKYVLIRAYAQKQSLLLPEETLKRIAGGILIEKEMWKYA